MGFQIFFDYLPYSLRGCFTFLAALAHGVPTRYADRRAPQTAAELSTMTRNAEFCPKILIFGLFEFLDFKDLILGFKPGKISGFQT